MHHDTIKLVSKPKDDIVTAIPPPAPRADTSGPSFGASNLYFNDCRAFGQADVSDPSGVGWMKLGYNLNGEGWKWVWMQNTVGVWQSEAGAPLQSGIGTPIGDIQYQFKAADTLGNESTSSVYRYNYTSCSG